MIKINLLNSVTDRQAGAIATVDQRVSSPTTRLLLMSMVVFFLLAAVIGWDVISTQMAKTEAEHQLEEQKQIEKELEGVIKEQKELEAKIAAIDGRINAIKKLRDEQRGPWGVLEAVRERIAMVPGLYLQGIEQKGDTVEIKGNSPDETAVTQFGRSLEFSNGLFSNLNIETRREEVVNQAATVAVAGGTAPKVNLVNFSIKTTYKPAQAPGGTAPNATQATNASAPGAAPQPQAAKN